jgi:YHS domain-containing protein
VLFMMKQEDKMPNRRHILAFAVAAPALALLGHTAHAGDGSFYNNGGVAIDGSDPVAYFTQGQPVAGSADITHDWGGVTWRFASQENRDTFVAAPERYAPQYGGYCAWAVSEGYTASTVPEAWRIVDGKLYLNFSRRIQGRWERDVPGHIASADANWPGVLN